MTVGGAADTFDAVAAGAFGCTSRVTVLLSIIPFVLFEKDLKAIALALKWLKTSEVKQIKFHEFAKEGIEDEELFKRLRNNLELWIKNLSGYQVLCDVLSP